MMDIDENKRSDFQDEMENIRKSEEYQEQTSLKRDVESNKVTQHKDKMGLEQQKMDLARKVSDDKLAIARENKNKYDVKSTEDKKKK